MKWISIQDEKPKPTKQLLILISGRIASVAKFNGLDFTEDELDVEDVTHWCYLPEIPKLQLVIK